MVIAINNTIHTCCFGQMHDSKVLLRYLTLKPAYSF